MTAKKFCWVGLGWVGVGVGVGVGIGVKPYLSRPEVASVSSGERSILFLSRGALPAEAEGVELTPVAACLGTMAWAVVPGSTIPLTGEKLPKGEPNIPIGRQDFAADAALDFNETMRYGGVGNEGWGGKGKVGGTFDERWRD